MIDRQPNETDKEFFDRSFLEFAKMKLKEIDVPDERIKEHLEDLKKIMRGEGN